MKTSLKLSYIVLLLVLILPASQLVTCSSASTSSKILEDHDEGRMITSRRMLISRNKTPVSANVDKLGGGSTMEPEKAVVNGLRKRPPSSSNPTQNK
ncbi:OLC1v1005840C1 [Oldenlandia corymbosa var. corymbosa]|uniref:OLC1v1005840C1 n=1 Tax=Oldenlandia corymbosa var. corymbosa TaxID=529605 RepID=A0AAV1DII0_OLDCO|nr:OLC1v1005840C1 [Oldenlandia corymbosa var. corymbosa]